MHNFMLYPMRLNAKRGTLPMTEAIRIGHETQALGRASGDSMAVQKAADLDRHCITYRGHFVPSKKSRGKLARSVGYVMMAHPELADVIHERVLDVHTLLWWHHTHPISPWEVALDSMIHSAQGRHNTLVNTPESIWDAVAPLNIT
ncbi:hypothetical protein TSOC_014404 [Tetrabaena socialis]|uniref:Uncharacterized protein n=1 Tax=Tetrabaena socialis TaxID=47790 RepID=A0A2J7ZHQ5_9CHLO|nr:hypothetical protein TSOC_014404 [Tetrabaena socialis]|eukprot:PNG99805.1 hypothetical protein TSOC_014404 [Tetrabaena socialis]